MLACEIVQDVGPDGRVCFDLPELIGKKVRIVYTTVSETSDNDLNAADEHEFTAAAYLAGIEEDDAEDNIWEKYIQ